MTLSSEGQFAVARRFDGKLSSPDGGVIDFVALIGPLEISDDGKECWCRLHCPALMEKSRDIHGSTPLQAFDLAESLVYWLAAEQLVELRETQVPVSINASWTPHIAERFAVRLGPPRVAVTISGGVVKDGKTRTIVATVSAPAVSVVGPAMLRVLDCPALLTEARVFTGFDADVALTSALHFLHYWAELRGGYFGPPTFV